MSTLNKEGKIRLSRYTNQYWRPKPVFSVMRGPDESDFVTLIEEVLDELSYLRQFDTHFQDELQQV